MKSFNIQVRDFGREWIVRTEYWDFGGKLVEAREEKFTLEEFKRLYRAIRELGEAGFPKL